MHYLTQTALRRALEVGGNVVGIRVNMIAVSK